jgi:hypothetical protein
MLYKMMNTKIKVYENTSLLRVWCHSYSITHNYFLAKYNMKFTIPRVKLY